MHIRNISFKLDELNPLHRNFLFWVATFLPLLFAVLMAFPLFKNLYFNFTEDGYVLFFSKFKLSLSIAALSIPFGMVVSKFHSSAQKVATITQSKLQNNFANYLSHRDHFQKYMQTVSDEFDLKIDAFKMYGIIFNKSTLSGVSVEIGSGIFDFYEKQYEDHFWSKMKFSAPNFTAMEVNIYFPRFAKEVGINAEKIIINDYESLKSTLIKIRKIYRRGMEYGLTRADSSSSIELEEYGFSELTGRFDLWSNSNGFKNVWKP
ncbi:hypothetical protein [Iodobacter sp.]|uniref:hypothetical protein n=1 Tax=Iodobacter sp. TaxID=1915058 RepID=UPI0025F439D1|nr:hypothetical protein [Iodobacter sp.]